VSDEPGDAHRRVDARVQSLRLHPEAEHLLGQEFLAHVYLKCQQAPSRRIKMTIIPREAGEAKSG